MAHPAVQLEEKPDPLAELQKMSTTAGVASAQYVAINIASVVAMLFALASGLVFVTPLLLFVPVFGLVASFVALRQISNSAGTQSGRWLAIGAIVLCFGCASVKVGLTIYNQQRIHADEQKIGAVVEQFGNDVRDSKYAEAMRFYSPTGKAATKWTDVRDYWEAAKRAGGPIINMHWNGIEPSFAMSPQGDVRTATIIVIVKMGAGDQRVTMLLSQTNNDWVIDEFPIAGQ